MIEDMYLISFFKSDKKNLSEKILKYFIFNSDSARVVNYNDNVEIFKSKNDEQYFSFLIELSNIFLGQKYTNHFNTFYLELFNNSNSIFCLDTESLIIQYEECYKKELISVIKASIEDEIPIIQDEFSDDKKKKIIDMIWYVENTIANKIHNEEILLANDGRVTVNVVGYNVDDLFNGRYSLLFNLYSKEMKMKMELFKKGIWDKKNYECIVYYNTLIRLALDSHKTRSNNN